MNELTPKADGFQGVLRSELSSYASLVFAGLVKNAGKTTAFNRANSLFPDETLGLTSIGYDGEAFDAIYHHPKPPIPVRPGQLILTAERFLPETPNGYKLLESWGSHPQFGAWLILEITAPGDFRIAGPSSRTELLEGISRLSQHGATRIHIDGAFNRLSHISLRTLQNPKKSVQELGIILSTGAALGNTLQAVAERTQHVLELFQLPALLSSAPAHPLEHSSYFQHGAWVSLPTFLWNQDLLSLLPVQADSLYLKGALTDFLYLALRTAGRLPRQFVVPTPAHLLLSPQVWSGLKSRGIEVKLLECPRLALLTLNPWHPITPIPTVQLAQALLPFSQVPLVDIQKQLIWVP